MTHRVADSSRFNPPLDPRTGGKRIFSFFQEKRNDSSVNEEEDYLFPPLRTPPLSPRHDTFYAVDRLTLTSAHGPCGVFVQDKDIIRKHVMKYIDCGPYKATSKVIAITREGKHVVWQQAIRSCSPTAISMIALDRGKKCLDKEITYPVTTNERELAFIKEAGFEPQVHCLTGNPFQKVQILEKLLDETGTGVLRVIHPEVGSHSIVLDAISWETQRVTLRDPLHGRMITVKLRPFTDWIGGEFIRCSTPPSN
jgi:hypothetical protein